MKIRAALKTQRIDSRLAPGADPATLAVRAQAAGVIDAAEALLLAKARELTAQVIRVDDFAQDLGASEMQTAAAAESGNRAGNAASRHKVAA